MVARLNEIDVMDRFKEKHGDRYDYSKVKFKGTKVKVCIVCLVHGEFWQTPAIHFKGNCPKCVKEAHAGKVSLTTKDVIKLFKIKHGGSYDYSAVEYTNTTAPVKIICRNHGKFHLTPHDHLKGQVCPVCYSLLVLDRARIAFLTKSTATHGTKYNYSKVYYVNSATKVCIICPDHGEFWQTPGSHSQGTGCPECGLAKCTTKLFNSADAVVKKFKEIHGSKYTYSKVNYCSSKVKVCIICPDHGEFWQQPADHYNGHGCPKCAHHVSHTEQELFDWLPVKVEQSNRKLIKKELDMLMPEHNLAIEFNGLYWHSIRTKNKSFHFDKTKACERLGIRLVHIWEDDWLFRKDIIKSFIGNLLNISCRKVYARHTEFKRISHSVCKEFLFKNHIQGPAPATHYFGLYKGSELVSVCTFVKCAEGYELNRHACLLNTRVLGALGKHTKNFQRLYAKPIISFCDLSMYNGKSYLAAGFRKESILKPDYKYVIGKSRKHKFNFRRKMLPKFLGDKFDPELSEVKNMENNGFYRIYDCGKLKFILDI